MREILKPSEQIFALNSESIKTRIETTKDSRKKIEYRYE